MITLVLTLPLIVFDVTKWERPERNEDVIFRDDVTNEFPKSLELAVIVVWFFLSVP